MNLPKNLIKEFAKVTNDSKKEPSEVYRYGKIVMHGSNPYIKIDGADTETPVDTTCHVDDGDRAMVLIKDHTATVTSNISNPTAGSKQVEKIDNFIAGNLTTEKLDARYASVNNLNATNANVEDLKAKAITTDNLNAKLVETDALNATNARVATLESTTVKSDELKAKYATIQQLQSDYATIENLNSTNATVDDLKAKAITTDNLNANLVKADAITAANARIDDLDSTTVKADVLKANYTDTKTLEAKYATVENLTSNYSKTSELDAKFATINELHSDYTNTENLNATYAKISTLEADYAKTSVLDSKFATINELHSDYMKAKDIQADYAHVDLANVTTESVGTLLADSGVLKSSTIVDGKVTGELDAVTLNADRITAGTLTADRLLLKGSDKGVLYELNNSGDLTSTNVDTLDGGVLTDHTITADKLVAKSITSNEIATGTLTIDNMGSQLKADINSITSKVSKTDFNGQNVVSLINQSADNVTIAANKIDLKGAVTISDLDSDVQSEIQNAKNAADGVLEKANAAQDAANSANDNVNAIKNNIYVPNTTTINGEKIATGSVKAEQIDTDSLFAQTINATGTIKGARLISDKGRIAGWNIDTDAFWNKDEQSDNTHTAVLGNGTELNSIIFTDEDGNPYTDDNGTEYSMDDGVVIAVESAGANGVNPDVPFYVRNDGYAYLKKVYISGESGSKIDADLIVGKIRADQIDAQGIKVNAADIIGRLGANQIDANNLTINAGNIRGKLTANQIDVDNIFAQNINATGIINGGTIKGATIAGATGSFTGSINATEITAKSSISVYGGSWSGTETAVQSVYMANTIFSQLFPNSMAVQIGLSAVDNPSGYNPAGGAGNVYVGNLYSGYVTCINGFNNYSSRVIKTNIVPESEESARRILDLDVVKFDYKPGVCPDDSRFDRRGLIAEDTLNVMPEIVYIPDEYKKNGYTGDNTKVPSIDYTKLIPDLVKMIQIQQKQLDRVPKNTAGTTTLYFADSDHVIIFSRSQADATAVVRVCNAEFRESNPIFIKDVVFSIESDSWLVYIDKKTTGYLKVNYTITVQEES